MNSFIRQLLFFTLLYLVISVGISFFTPYHWGNPWFSSKIQFLEKKKEIKYNTFFLGSSRIYRQINPILFDSTFNSISLDKTNSFNLGAPATFNPQTYYLFESFLNSNLSQNTKYCFIELMEVDLLDDYFMHQERTTYWQNPSDLFFVFKSIYMNKNLDIKKKLKSASNYCVSYLEKVFRLGHFGKQIVESNYYDSKYVGIHRDGFFSLELDFETTNNKKVKKHLFDRKKTIIKKPRIIEKRKKRIAKLYKNISNDYDGVNLNKVLELIQKSNQKGILLIFIISPRNVSKQLLSLSRQIPENNLIDMANPRTYPELYEYKNSFDVGHLNSTGANLYSKMLAREFEKKARTHNKD